MKNTSSVSAFSLILPFCMAFFAASSIAQTSYEQFIVLARTEADAQRYTTAIAASEKAIAIDPAKWDAYAIRGVAQQQQHDYAAAIISFSQAIAFAPADKKAALQRLLEETVATKTVGTAAPQTPTPQPQAAAPTDFVDIDAYVFEHVSYDKNGQYNGKPVANIEVVARRLDVPQTSTTRTESNGEFRFFHLPAGQYLFEARANGKRYGPQNNGNCCGFGGGTVDLRIFTKEHSGLPAFSFALELPY